MTQSQLLQAETLLQSDARQNAYLLLRLHQGAIGQCFIQNKSVCLWDKEHNKYGYFIQNEEDFRALYALAQQHSLDAVSFVTDIQWQPHTKNLNSNIQFSLCYQLQAIPYTQAIPHVEDIVFKPVTTDMTNWVLEVYHHPEVDAHFVAERSANAPSVAAYYQDQPVAFFLTHSDAELGPVYIDPRFRGTGLSEAIYAQMINLMPNQLELPILFVKTDNATSKKWLMRMGCIPAAQEVFWFWRE